MATTAKGYRYPAGTDPNNTPADIQRLAEDVDASPGIRAYTQAEIDALPAAQKWTGRKVWNVTAGVHQNWNGAQWVSEGGGSLAADTELLLGDAGALVGTDAGIAGRVVLARNAVVAAGVWSRLVADNDASMVRLEENGDLVFYTNTDAGGTVGSTITWGEKFRIYKNGIIQARRPGTGMGSIGVMVDGDVQERLMLTSDGILRWGPGGATVWDTNLFRSQADVLRTNDAFHVDGELWAKGNFAVGDGGAGIKSGNGSPEGVVVGYIGGLYLRRDGVAGSNLYVKVTGNASNTGWQRVATAA